MVEDSALVVMQLEYVIAELGWVVVGPALRLIPEQFAYQPVVGKPFKGHEIERTLQKLMD